MKIIIDEKKIDEILERGNIAEILPSKKEFRNKLLKGQKMKFYIGFDPTASALHLGHARNIMILEEFRKLGHQVIVLFGDFTAQIGDPSGKSKARKQLTKKQVLENVKKWKEQIQPLMNFDDKENPPLIKYNSDWLAKMNFAEILSLASNFTVQQMIERNMFQTRINDKKPIFLHEFLYPLMQGWDSVIMDVDVELCGTDQTFNALIGRDLQKRYNKKDKFIVAGSLLEDSKTGKLMSKSEGTGIFLDTNALDLYGQIMAQSDEMIEILFINCTYLSLSEIKEILISQPRDAKLRLAYEIVKIFYKQKKAEEAQKNWINQFSKKELPLKICEFKPDEYDILSVLTKSKLTSSKSEAKRIIEQKGIKIDGIVIKDIYYVILPGSILQKGKIKFLKIM